MLLRKFTWIDIAVILTNPGSDWVSVVPGHQERQRVVSVSWVPSSQHFTVTTICSPLLHSFRYCCVWACEIDSCWYNFSHIIVYVVYHSSSYFSEWDIQMKFNHGMHRILKWNVSPVIVVWSLWCKLISEPSSLYHMPWILPRELTIVSAVCWNTRNQGLYRRVEDIY